MTENNKTTVVELQDDVSSLKILSTLTASIADQNQGIECLLEWLTDHFRFQVVFFWRFDPVGEVLLWSHDRCGFASLHSAARAEIFGLDSHPLGQAVLSKDSVIETELTASNGVVESEALRLGLVSRITMPIVLDKRVLGVIQGLSSMPLQHSPAKSALWSCVAQWMSTVMEQVHHREQSLRYQSDTVVALTAMSALQSHPGYRGVEAFLAALCSGFSIPLAALFEGEDHRGALTFRCSNECPDIPLRSALRALSPRFADLSAGSATDGALAVLDTTILFADDAGILERLVRLGYRWVAVSTLNSASAPLGSILWFLNQPELVAPHQKELLSLGSFFVEQSLSRNRTIDRYQSLKSLLLLIADQEELIPPCIPVCDFFRSHGFDELCSWSREANSAEFRCSPISTLSISPSQSQVHPPDIQHLLTSVSTAGRMCTMNDQDSLIIYVPLGKSKPHTQVLMAISRHRVDLPEEEQELFRVIGKQCPPIRVPAR